MGLRQDRRSRDCQGAVSPPQESGPATSLRPTQGDQNPRVFDGAAMGLRPTQGNETSRFSTAPGNVGARHAVPEVPHPPPATHATEPRTPVSGQGPNTIAKAPPLPNNPSPHIPTRLGCSFRKPCSPAQTSSGNAAISSTSGTASGSFAKFTWCRYFRHDSQTCTCRCSISGAA